MKAQTTDHPHDVATDRGISRRIAATPSEVFAVLADGWLYPTWVVGAARMREVDDSWPSQRARLHHSFGVWPFLIDDETEIIAWEPPRRAVLEARGWPLGTARVEIAVTPDAQGGCLVRIHEDPNKGPGQLIPKPVRQALIMIRNHETLKRLAFIAESGDRS